MSKIKSFKNFFFGDPEQISSERYFISVTTFISTFFLFLLCFIHLFIGLDIAPVIYAGSSSLVVLVLYYLVRFQNWVFIPKLILTVGSLIMLDITWYSKFLSSGPVLFYILIFAALLLWVWEGKSLIFILILYFLNVAVLFYIDYNASEAIMTYPDQKTRSIDIFINFTLYSILLIFLLRVVKVEFLRQKGKAVESDKLKSAFLANMSHEIRTPMNGILGFSELLKEPNLSKVQHEKYIEIIQHSGKRMLNLINDIIDISKIESGLTSVTVKEANAKEMVDYIYTFFKPETEKKGIQFFNKNSIPTNEAIINTDTDKLYIILINLVKNAIKYTDKGSIEIGCEIIKDENNQLLQFYVKDTGIGIHEEKQSEIFDRFIQADIADEMARQGAGLGLSIAKAYVEILDGKIWLESKINKGSTFYITIPYTPVMKQTKKVEKSPAPEKTEPIPPKLKILIVEDDETSEMLLTHRMDKFGKEIMKARSGIEAIEIYRNNTDIDLVLMDIKLPEVNGYEATKQIRQFSKDVTIIAQTAYGLAGDKEKALAAGCDDYISKPIDPKLLESLVYKYFSN